MTPFSLQISSLPGSRRYIAAHVEMGWWTDFSPGHEADAATLAPLLERRRPLEVAFCSHLPCFQGQLEDWKHRAYYSAFCL